MKRFDQLSPANKQLVIGLFCQSMNYQSQIIDPTWVGDPAVQTPPLIPNPETQQQFVTRLAYEWIVWTAIKQRAINQTVTPVPTDQDL